MKIIFHPSYLQHQLAQAHPERPQRMERILSVLNPYRSKLEFVQPGDFGEDPPTQVHSAAYLARLKSLSNSGGILDLDTPAPAGFYQRALIAAHGAIQAGLESLHGPAFALIRPPGHHAGTDFGGGFCYLNNIAIMIRYLQSRKLLSRAAILDWDVHHGNGTQQIFYSDPSVLYFSVHQYPLYPGTGKLDELGEGEGRGFNINIPVPPGTTGADFIQILEQIFVPVIQQYKPQLIGISAGYDAHFSDPLASLNFCVGTYHSAGRILAQLSSELNSKLALVLEGGYHLEAVSHGVLATILGIMGMELEYQELNAPLQQPKLDLSRYKRAISEHWQL